MERTWSLTVALGCTLSLTLTTASWGVAPAGENLLVNGDFERGETGWSELWTRQGAARLRIDTVQRHGGRQSARIEHEGERDWSLAQANSLDVEPGQIYELSAWIRVEGKGDATLCVILRNAENSVTEWAFAGRTVRAGAEWRELRSRFTVPPGTVSLLPRLIGNGPATVWLDDVVLSSRGTLSDLRAKDLPETLEVANDTLAVELHVEDGTLTLVDRRTKTKWVQRPSGELAVLDARSTGTGLDLKLLEPRNDLEIHVTLRLEPEAPELTVELAATGAFAGRLSFPQPFVTGPGTFLVMPVNEGISYPVDDESLPPMRYHLYGGHGLCMAWYGVTDGRQGIMTMVETPDDAAVNVPRTGGRLCLSPEWVPQKGQFGPPRRLRYIAIDRGGYVAMSKRYRRYAREVGRLKTLAEKRAGNPNVDLLVGAVNVWCWERDAARLCREMQSLGIDRILWSHRSAPGTIRELNTLAVLTSRYDIYQDTMNPAVFPKLRGVHPDWTTEAWPRDLMIGADGAWRRGWRVKGRDGEWYPCGVLCDRQAVDYARRRIPPELKTHPYRCRFIDTTTASAWRECYHDDHPMTRTGSRHWKMRLLEFVAQDCGLVTGSETGHEAAVPYVHYFEGMLSLGPYRVPNAGRDMLRMWDEVPERVARFQTGHFYRLPLWELVYHDCVVAQWYWGDYNNKLPSLWDRRDLFNALYGTPPMFMFNRKIWRQYRDRFVESYKRTAPVARATGYTEMLSHRWLTPDHAVQESRFGSGVVVTVNFGDTPYTMSDGTVLGPLSERIEGLDEER